MPKKPTARLIILEAMAKLGPAPGYAIAKLSKVPTGSLYVGLRRMVEEGLVYRGEPPLERVWYLTKAGEAVAEALRTHSDSEQAF